MKQIIFFLLVTGIFIVGCSKSQSQAATQADNQKAISVKEALAPQQDVSDIGDEGRALLKKTIESNSELEVERVENTPIAGFYAVFLKQGDIVYSNADGSYFIAGDLYKIRPDVKGLENVTEKFRAQQRVGELDNIDQKSTITFSPKGEAKGHIYVFTDVDCYYCQKLHQEVAELNKQGLEVRYLAFPRAGLNSESYQKIQSAWCAKDKQSAMNKLKARQEIPSNNCSSTAVADQFHLGQSIGVRGTPAIFTEQGELISGYLPSKQLLERVGIN